MNKQNLTSEAAFERRKISTGIIMTILYLIVYGGFVALCVFRPGFTGVRAIFGLNLATAYGLGLIITAVIFALLYNRLCRTPSSEKRSEASKGE